MNTPEEFKALRDKLAAADAEIDRLTRDNDRANDRAQTLWFLCGKLRVLLRRALDVAAKVIAPWNTH